MKILSNLDYPIGGIINQEMMNARSVQVAVAFLRYSGIKEIEKSLRQCLDSGGKAEFIVGLDFKFTDPNAMDFFVRLCGEYPNAKFYCFGDNEANKTDIVFHPKIYLFERANETTGIVGSTNLTKGGLTSNFEVNVIFKEKKPLYYSQLQAIYNSVKFRDSVFVPDEEYLRGYASVCRAFKASTDKVGKGKDVRKTLMDMEHRRKFLPRAQPALRTFIAEVIEKQRGQDFVKLADIYAEVDILVKKREAQFGMQDFNASIRGELNKHEQSGQHPDNMRLFVRSPDKAGFYALTETGRKYLQLNRWA